MSSHYEEKRGLTQSFKSQTGYGTAAVSSSSKKSVPKTRLLIRKKVSRTDTLMGIALKYGVTVQDLKKENRLWTNDSLFLRETLLIPLTSDNQETLDPDDVIVSIEGNSQSTSASPHPSTHRHSKDSNSETISSTSAVLEVNSDSCPPEINNSQSSSFKKQSKSSSLSSPSSSSSRSSPPRVPDDAHSEPHSNGRQLSNGNRSDDPRAGSDDFFSKYDITIARLKGNVAKMETNASDQLNNYPFLKENPMALPSPKNTNRQHNRRRSSGGSSTSSSRSSFSTRRAPSPPRRIAETDDHVSVSSDDNLQHPDPSTAHDSPVLMIRSRTNSKMIQNTLQKYRRASEDLFEL